MADWMDGEERKAPMDAVAGRKSWWTWLPLGSSAGSMACVNGGE